MTGQVMRDTAEAFPPAYVGAALKGEIARIIDTPKGQGLRNQAINRASFNVGRLVGAGALPMNVARDALLKGATGYVADHGQDAALSVIDSGLRAGAQSPRRPPNRAERRNTIATNGFRPAQKTRPVALVTVASKPPAPRPASHPFPLRTLPDEQGNPRFHPWGDDAPPALQDELRRHVYRSAGMPVRIKIKNKDGSPQRFSNWYRVCAEDGTAGWQSKKPEGYRRVPYVGGYDPRDPEMINSEFYWPEGERDVDTLASHNLPALTFGGVGDGLPEGIEPVLQGRDIIILADNDEAGRQHAEKKAMLAHAGGAARVRVIEFDEFPPKADVTDFFAAGGTSDELQRRADATPEWLPHVDTSIIEPIAEPFCRNVAEVAASHTTDDGPIPLIAQLAPALEYPVDALGPVLASAARAIASKVQAPIEIAAQSVLATASLAAQAHADLQMSFGQQQPLSLFFVTVAPSGARKTSTDTEALWPARKREAVLAEEYSRDMEGFRIDHAAWEAERKSIETNKKLDYNARKQALTMLGPAPQPPLHPVLTAPEPTIEGLLKNWPSMHASLGLFSAEGGQFVGGHGMSDEHRLKTAAALSELWDGRAPRRIRAGDGINDLRGRRLALHLMVQPAASAQFLSDSALRDQGLLSRILVAAPASIAGTRLFREASEQDNAAIRSYGATMLRLFERPARMMDGKRNELAPRLILFTPEADVLWRKFYNRIECQSAPGGRLSVITDFASKAAEHAARISGVLSVVEDPNAWSISDETMRNGIALADWYVDEALRLAAMSMTSPATARAQRLLVWLHDRSVDEIAVRDICRMAPPELRAKPSADEAVRILCDHGWLKTVSEKPKRYRVAKKASL